MLHLFTTEVRVFPIKNGRKLEMLLSDLLSVGIAHLRDVCLGYWR